MRSEKLAVSTISHAQRARAHALSRVGAIMGARERERERERASAREQARHQSLQCRFQRRGSCRERQLTHRRGERRRWATATALGLLEEFTIVVTGQKIMDVVLSLFKALKRKKEALLRHTHKLVF